MAGNFFDQFDSSAAPSPYADAISKVESGGNYRAVGPNTGEMGRALGKYQVMSANVGPWSKEVIGREVTPQEFISNPEIQDAIFNGKFGSYVDKYGPDGAARAWFAGEKGMKNPNAKDAFGTTVSEYSRRFNKALGPQNAEAAVNQFAPEGPQALAFAEDKRAKPETKNFFDQFDDAPVASPTSVPAKSANGLKRVYITGSDAPATIAERSNVGPAPENADALKAGLVQAGSDKISEPTSNAYKITMDFLNQGSAAGQRTSPHISAHMPNLISADTYENDAGEILYTDPQTGALQKTDNNKQVALRDPADGKIKIFARTPDTDEGVLSSSGRILGTGLASGAPTSRAIAPAVQAAQELKPGQQVIAAADRLSQTGSPVQVPRAVATDSMPTQQVAATASNVPIAGAPLVKAAERTIGQLGTKADEVAQGFGGAASVQEAGDTARSAIKNWITGESAGKATKLYDRVDGLVDPNVKTTLEATRRAVAEIAAKRSSAALAPGKATDSVLDAVQRPGGLTYEGVKTLRTNIGEMLKGGILPEGMSGSELEKIYGALSKDLQVSVKVAGGERAAEAFHRANQYYRLVSDRRAALAKIVGADGNAPAETVLSRIEAMAGSSSRADISKLVQARKAIGVADWNEIASTVVTRLGRDVEGNFTPQRFLTAYGKISPAGKDILFRSAGKSDLASHLDDIARVSSRFKELQKFANPSGSGRTIIGGSIGTGLMIEPLTTVASVIGTRVLSNVLAKPAAAASVAKVMKAQEALVFSPSPARLAAYNTASRNLINTIGAKNLSPADFLKALQGSVPSRAQDEQQ